MSTLDQNGLVIDTLQEIIDYITQGTKDIYGSDINVDSNTPDGQLININAQRDRDILEVLRNIYNSYDIEHAVGSQLDSIGILKDIPRQGATFTLQQVQITIDRSLTLQGLDDRANDTDGTGYTVKDNAGTEFILLDTVNLATAGTYNLTFRAKNLGSITTIPNDITNPVTVVVGITDINNSTGVLSIGRNSELDSEYRIRLTRSNADNSKGWIDALTTKLLNIQGVTDARVYENFSDITDSNGIPAHSIWAIVEGGANTDIANQIYRTKNAGAGMKGSILINIPTANGSFFPARFDRPISKQLYIRFNIKPTLAGQGFDLEAIKDYIVNNLEFSIGSIADASTITCIAKDGIIETGGKGTPVSVEISRDGINYTDFLEVDTVDEKWILDKSRIDITII